MKNAVFIAVLTSIGLAVILSAALAARPTVASGWNPRAAAAYLDQRQNWWESWPKASRDHGTVCVSCHTALPYALVRPELRDLLHEDAIPPAERKLVADVVTRVRAWSQVAPFYGDWSPAKRQKAVESRGTEAVLNALILASRDKRAGVVSKDAQAAFANMFALQEVAGEQAGAWPWLNFGLRPWESKSATYFGAALAAIALGMEPRGFAGDAEIRPNVQRLRAYLQSHLDQSLWNRVLLRDDPYLFNRAMLLWASANLPDLVSSEERQSIVQELWTAQGPDGEWRLSALGRWRRSANVTADSTGDGYATGLIAYALEQAGIPAADPRLARALAWLAQHQDTVSGAWTAWSLNENRDLGSYVGKFMSDAATAFAVLALARAEVIGPAVRRFRENTPAGHDSVRPRQSIAHAVSQPRWDSRSRVTAARSSCISAQASQEAVVAKQSGITRNAAETRCR